MTTASRPFPTGKFPNGERRLLNLPDCVFLTEQGRCRILRVPECTGETCSFCRSRACAEDANRRWKTRMNVLDDARQARIAAAYFGGKMPWKEGKNG